MFLQRGSDELLSQAAVMAPASDNNNQDLATKKAKLDSTSTVLGGVGEYPIIYGNGIARIQLIFNVHIFQSD